MEIVLLVVSVRQDNILPCWREERKRYMAERRQGSAVTDSVYPNVRLGTEQMFAKV